MKRIIAAAAVLLLLCGSLIAVAASGSAVARPAVATTPVVGNVSGPTVLAYAGSHSYEVNASGGPAFATNGTLVGNLTYSATVVGLNLTGTSFLPATGHFTTAAALSPTLVVGNVSEVLTLEVEIASVLGSANDTLNLTYTVDVVQPYVLSLTLVASSSATVLPFVLTVDLDGTPVGSISVPTLTARETKVVTFQLATSGLSSGEHTFTVSLAKEHGLVTFAGGATSYSQTFYIPGAPPSYTLWYLAGAVAFFGAIFIFVTRVAARRRTPSRK